MSPPPLHKPWQAHVSLYDPTIPSFPLSQEAALVDAPSGIALPNDTALPLFLIPFLKLHASEKVQELLNFRYHVAVLALEGLLSASFFFSHEAHHIGLYTERMSVHLPHGHPDLPRLGHIHSGCAARSLQLGFQLHRSNGEKPLTWDFRA